MRSGDQVFSELTDYLTIDGFKRNPVIEYNTLYADYQWKVYAVFFDKFLRQSTITAIFF